MMKQKNFWLPRDLPSRVINRYCCVFLFSVVTLASCSKERFQWKTKVKNTRVFITESDSTLQLEGVSKDINYGFAPDRPIKLGVTNRSLALTYPAKYFNSLAGPTGEVVYFRRIKSCCPFRTVNSEIDPFQNVAVLEVYEVIYKGLKEPLTVYINFFDEGKVYALKGFSIKPFN